MLYSFKDINKFVFFKVEKVTLPKKKNKGKALWDMFIHPSLIPLALMLTGQRIRECVVISKLPFIFLRLHVCFVYVSLFKYSTKYMHVKNILLGYCLDVFSYPIFLNEC